MYIFADYSSAALVKTQPYPRPHLLSALTVGVCKGQGDTERVEGGRAEMDTAGASEGYTNEVIIIYYSLGYDFVTNPAGSSKILQS